MLSDVEMHTFLPRGVACWSIGVVEREIQLADGEVAARFELESGVETALDLEDSKTRWCL